MSIIDCLRSFCCCMSNPEANLLDKRLIDEPSDSEDSLTHDHAFESLVTKPSSLTYDTPPKEPSPSNADKVHDDDLEVPSPSTINIILEKLFSFREENNYTDNKPSSLTYDTPPKEPSPSNADRVQDDSKGDFIPTTGKSDYIHWSFRKGTVTKRENGKTKTRQMRDVEKGGVKKFGELDRSI